MTDRDATPPKFMVTRRNGDVFEVLVSAEDHERVKAAGPWHVQPDGQTVYVQRHIPAQAGSGRTTQKLHQFILGIAGVDHVNCDGLDNRRSNLRPATNAQNLQNRRLDPRNSSGFRGVHFRVGDGKWQAEIKLNGRKRYLGSFDTAVEAGEVAARARAESMPFSREGTHANGG